jgi:hypothetical protein
VVRRLLLLLPLPLLLLPLLLPLPLLRLLPALLPLPHRLPLLLLLSPQRSNKRITLNKKADASRLFCFLAN